MMTDQRDFQKYSRWALAAFSTLAVVAIFWQHLVWVAVALWLVAWSRAEVAPKWPRGPLSLATLLFLGTFLTGALFGVDPHESFRTAHKYLTLLLFFLIGAMVLSASWIQRLLLLFTIGASVCAFRGILAHFFFGEGRISSFSGHIMVFGGMLMAAGLLQFAFLVRNPRNPWNWIRLALIAEAALLNQTRGAWVGLVAGLLLMLWLYRRKWILPAALILLTAFFILPEKYQTKVRSIWDPSIRRTNYERVWMWESGWEISKDHPWFGIGLGNLASLYSGYHKEGAHETRPAHLHNNFVQILVQNGWFGLAGYLFWIGAFYFTAFRNRAGPREDLDWNGVLTCIFTAILVWGLTEYTFSHQIMNVQSFFLGLQANLWRARSSDLKGTR